MADEQQANNPNAAPEDERHQSSWLTRIFGVDPKVERSFFWSASWFFTVLGGYYIVRPVREMVGSMEGAEQLPFLFTVVFLTMLIAVPLYSYMASRFRRRDLVPIVYRFLALNLVAFSIAMRLPGSLFAVWIAPIFFVWVAVYNLFATSLFWSVQADVFSRDRAKSLFGAIAGCGTAGSLAASFTVGATGEFVGPANLLFVAACLMEIGLYCFRRLDVSNSVETGVDDVQQTGVLAGFVQVVRSPYLRGIVLYTLVTTLCATYLYYTQAEMLNAVWPDDAQRMQVFARIDFGVQAVAICCQFFIAARLMKLSLTLTLCVLPAIYLAGVCGLAIIPGLAVLIVVMVLSRGTTYGLAVPAVSVLYTVVSRSDKYKAKNVIDTLVIRGADVAANWTITGIKAFTSAATTVAALMIPIATIGLGLGLLLGYRNSQANAATALPASDSNGDDPD